VLARPRWRALLIWQAAELCYFFAFYGELLQVSGSDDDPVPPWAMVSPEWVFVLASLGRLTTVAVLCGLVVRDVLRPAVDPVRQVYAGDPDAGPLLTTRTPRPARGLSR
jgi:hypothetical protein